MDFDKLEADKNLILTKHFTKGRSGRRVEFIVPHYAAGDLSLEGYYSVWQARQASAQYAVDSNGRCAQLVWDRDTAWSLGDFDANCRSINIEHSNLGDVITEECRETGAHLVAALCREYGLGRPEWGRNVRMHREFTATSCPGPLATTYRDSYIKRAQEWYDAMASGGSAPAPSPSPAPGADLGDTSWTGPLMVREWQSQRGTPVDGEISGQTRYNADTVQWAITVSPASGNPVGSLFVISLQEFLAARGYGVGSSGTDGHMGHDTVRALQRFLNDAIGAGLAVDGYYGNATSRAVGTALERGLFRQ